LNSSNKQIPCCRVIIYSYIIMKQKAPFCQENYDFFWVGFPTCFLAGDCYIFNTKFIYYSYPMPWRIIILLAAIAPGVFWLWYFLRKDKLKPEPKKMLIRLFARGLVIVIPAALIEMGLEIIVPIEWIGLVVFAPVVEELLKFWITKKNIRKNKAFDEPIDGVIYAIVVALGFATFENVFYLWDAFQTDTFGAVAVVRALVTVPGHALFASMWWYALSKAKFGNLKHPKRILLGGIGLGILFHAILNLLTLVAVWWAIGMMVLMIVLWLVFSKKLKKLLEG